VPHLGATCRHLLLILYLYQPGLILLEYPIQMKRVHMMVFMWAFNNRPVAGAIWLNPDLRVILESLCGLVY